MQTEETALAWFRTYRDTVRWKPAKSGPPHSYTIRDWDYNLDEQFQTAVILIRRYGYPEAFYKRTFIYWNVDGLKYWTMGNPLAETRIINRTQIENVYGNNY